MFNRLKKTVLFLGKKISLGLFLCVFLGIGLFFVEASLPFVIRMFLSRISLMESDHIRFWEELNNLNLNQVALCLCVIAAFRGMLQFSQIILSAWISETFKYRIRTRLMKVIYFEFSANTSDALSIFGELSSNSANFLSLISQSVSHTIIIGMLAFALFRLEPTMTFSIFSGSLLLGACFYFVSKNIRRRGAFNREYWNKSSRRIGLSIRNLPLIKIYGLESVERRRGSAYLSFLKKNTLKASMMTGGLQSIPQVLGLSLIFLIVVNGNFSSKVAPGTLIVYIFLTFRVFGYAAQLTQSLSQSMLQLEQFKDVYLWWTGNDVISKKSDLELYRKSKDKVKLKSEHSADAYGWKIENMSFNYKNGRKSCLQNLSFDIKPGSFFVMTGESGSGKTTLTYLLLGLLKPTEGEVNLLCSNKTYPVSSLYKSFLRRIGYVGPESFLVEGTLLDNLTFGKNSKVDKESLKKAIEMADCEFLYSFPNQLEHRITEQGQGLSQGQKQRLALGRALLRSPKVLILDEATANVDAETEQRLIKTFSKLKGKTTIIAVTHRPEILKIADHHLNLDLLKEQAPLGKVG